MAEQEKFPSQPTNEINVSCSTNLRGQYLAIGNALLEYESQYQFWTADNAALEKQFQIDVAFISSEVLDAYFEDLLDDTVKIESLGIKQSKRFSGSLLVSIFGMLLAVGFGIYAASVDTSPIYSFALTLVLAVPFSLLWHWHPRENLRRRMLFAQVVSHEVSRRRGDGTQNTKPRIGLKNLLAPRVRRTTATGAALTLVEN